MRRFHQINMFSKIKFVFVVILLSTLFKMFVISTLNINGMSTVRKQCHLINFMRYNSIDIMLLQEHNLREAGSISKELNDFCYISLNMSLRWNS